MADMGLVVVGAGGRMGRMLVKTISETEGCTLAGAIEQPGSIALGEDAGLLAGAGRANLAITDDPDAAFAHADGVLDFTAPAASVGFADIAAQAGIVHVVGTTGLEESRFRQVARGGGACPHRPVRQHVARRQPPRRARQEGRRDPWRGVRHRGPGDASPA